jgi:hypothetical protein
VAERAPQLLGEMRHHRRDQPDHGLERLAPGSSARPRVAASSAQRVDQLVDARDGAVEMERSRSLGHAGDRLVDGGAARAAAPSKATPASVHSRSRSGGLSDSMNQRAVSAP